MIEEIALKKRKESREHAIEDAIIAQPEALGFPGGLAIRNFRLADISGAVDIVLIPHDGPIRLALVETKIAQAPDAGSKVVGQLLMYYAGALTLGLDGIEALRELARNSPDLAHSIPRKSPQKVLLTVSGNKHPNLYAGELLGSGGHLSPNEVALFVAIDDEPRHVLQPLLRILRELHGLSIGLVIVRNGTPSLLLPGVGQQIVGREPR